MKLMTSNFTALFYFRRYVLAVLDCTVWPSNSTYLHHCIQMFNTVLSLSNKNAGLALMPIPHAQTSQNALLKHERLLQDQMVKAGLNVTHIGTILLDKQSVADNDKRQTAQQCRLVTTTVGQDENEWSKSHAWTKQTIGPLPLIKVSEMVGYDADSPPGPSARLAQNFGCRCSKMWSSR